MVVNKSTYMAGYSINDEKLKIAICASGFSGSARHCWIPQGQGMWSFVCSPNKLLSSLFASDWNHAHVTSLQKSKLLTSSLFWSEPVPCLNIKTVFPDMDFHHKDKTVVRQSYLYNGSFFTSTTTSLFWDGPRDWISATLLYSSWFPQPAN